MITCAALADIELTRWPWGYGQLAAPASDVPRRFAM
jgi:hypothetical protein